MKNIVLIGMMGCGKSTCGALLAQRLGRELADTDALIERREGRSIPDLFAKEGEAYFRRLEAETALELSRRTNLVVACGGGLPLHQDAMAALKATGSVVFLCRDPAQTFDTVPMDGRPLAQAGKAAFVARFREREPVYRRWADLVVTEFASPEATVDAILEGLA